MQGERSILKPFPETIDLNQVSGSNNASTDRPVAWSNVLNPVESRLSSYVPSSGHGNPNFSNPASHNGRTFSGWDPGESSSSANMQSQLNGHDSKVGQGWSPSINTRVGPEGRSADWQFEQPNVLLHESGTNSYRGNYFHRPLSISNSVSTRTSPNATVSGGYQSSSYDSWQGRGSGISPTFYRSGMSEIDQFATFDAGSTDVGTSSSSSGYLVRHDDGSVSSSSTWGLSCKRKVLEGNPGQSGSPGSLSVEPQDETIGRHTFPAHHDSSSGLAVSATSTNSPSANSQGQVNTRIASGMRGMTYDRFPSRVTEVAESSQRNFSFGVDLGRQEPTQFDLSAAGSDVRHSNTHSTSHQSRLISATESPELRAPFSRPLNLNSNPSQSPFMHVHGLARNRPPVSWSGSLNSRGGASSSPILFSGERGAAVRDEANFRSSLSNNPEHPSFVAARESRHMVQEPTAWSFSPGNSGSSRNVPSSSRYTPNSGTGPFSTVWMPHQNVTAHNQQRLSEFPPWTLFPSVEPDPGGQRSNFSFLPSASSSSEEAVMSSGSSSGDHNQPYSRSLLMEVSSDDINGWRALAAGIEGRHRIVSEIRQVLNAMRRAEYLRAEDYMMLDPFINGAAELHDRHRDMRLDVDNMSYEELLALEERIGNVSTGLSDNAILDALKHRRHQFVTDESPNLEPCCICQEEYRAGDDIGTLNCGHEFHTNCIKQWLTMKNLCPICKTTALET